MVSVVSLKSHEHLWQVHFKRSSTNSEEVFLSKSDVSFSLLFIRYFRLRKCSSELIGLVGLALCGFICGFFVLLFFLFFSFALLAIRVPVR